MVELCPNKYRQNSVWMAAMTQALDVLTPHNAVIAHRERAKAELDGIAQQAKQALADLGIDISLFFLIPSTGNSIITFGTISDPPDDEWVKIEKVVSAVVRGAVGLDRVQCREVICATTDTAPMPMASSQHSRAECSRTDRFRSSHPYLLALIIDPVDWDRLQQMADENLAVEIVGHDAPQGGVMRVLVACASAAVRDRLEDGWG
jgi:hypothetical protein